MDPLLETGLILLGALALVLALRWGMRKVAFRTMRFEVPARGRSYTFHRERFFDSEGREVTDPALLAELKESWAEIERKTARDVARYR